MDDNNLIVVVHSGSIMVVRGGSIVVVRGGSIVVVHGGSIVVVRGSSWWFIVVHSGSIVVVSWWFVVVRSGFPWWFCGGSWWFFSKIPRKRSCDPLFNQSQNQIHYETSFLMRLLICPFPFKEHTSKELC